ncbi:hypothetical protein [Sphingomonas sp. CFBP 13706]|uniref:hypothetical protein n=1 Tax=Sphingomonas sp. CFBP 13706 TaxID=2775314 RepID=UPI001780E8E4|nr:hypothetical protein [Sphingomonas sp. CFBP 13706]MBD8735361.1 hypothetical protein [Sphingomonas sp. CFBP 13706]
MNSARRFALPLHRRTESAASSIRSAGRRHSGPGWSHASWLGWASASLFTMAWGGAVSAAPPSLQPMTRAQVMEAGAGGTGCSWSMTGDRRMRFAAAGDRAAIRLGRAVMVLAPAPRSRELFPFTFADWRGEGVTVRVGQVGRARWVGTEASTARATLTVSMRGVSRRIGGTLSCGS